MFGRASTQTGSWSLPRDPRAYLHDILTAADAISGFLADADFDGYVENDLVRSAVERKFEIIGEALGQLAKVDAELAARVSRWRDIIAFRNIIAHGYASLDHTVVWRAHKDSLPALRAEVAALLAAKTEG
jgi:uncharacterized protein with HEPN domain